jgi:hypothetical protein
MGTTKPPSPTTGLSAIRAAANKLSSLSLVQGLLRIAPGLPAAALAGVVIMFFAWSCEHRARQRQAIEAQQIKKQSAEQISLLAQQASSALKDAHQSAQAAKELEGQRQQLARKADALQQSLESLHSQQLAHENELASLTTEEVVKRVMARLQEQVSGVRGQAPGKEAVSSQPSAFSKNADQRSASQAANPLTRPATADETAAAGQPLPQGGEGKSPAGREGTRQDPSAHLPTSPSAALVLSDQGVRKVEGAFLELDSCRQQSQVIAQQVSNCEQQAKLDSALEQQQAGTISKLNAALADKDQILARSEAAHRAELKAARGTWRTRFYHAVEIFAGGFVAGVLVR